MTGWRRASIRASSIVACGLVLVVAACAADTEVATERADPIGDAPDGRPPPAPADTALPDATGPGSVVWGTCDVFDIPDSTELGTDGWECATVDAPMDPFTAGGAELGTVQLAVTRHEATGDRRGSLVVNPGGPGASGLEAVWYLRSELPIELLRAYDVVSWDPRGVGASTPSISCGPAPDLDDPLVMIECSSNTGDLAGHLAAPYSAADLEQIRSALGDPTIDYLGYSYGTAIGAEYAARFPDGVGGFVLDGAIDPDVGGPAGSFADGFPFYADDGTEAALARFHELCDSTVRCLADEASSRGVVDVLRTNVDTLATDAFEPEPAVVDGQMLDGVVDSALYDVRDWPLLATALDDAWAGGSIGGDASTLAALVANDPVIGTDESDDDTGDDDEPEGGPAPFEVANLVIYCADFAEVIDDTQYCDVLSRNENRLAPVRPVDVERPILVVGTEFDPATPGYHAAEFADALGDAYPVVWEGVGHTVFPGLSSCIDDVVVAHLLDGVTPTSSPTCPFVDGAANDSEVAERVFRIDESDAREALFGVLSDVGGPGEDVACVADELSRETTRVVTHVVLDVRSTAAVDAAGSARAAC